MREEFINIYNKINKVVGEEVTIKVEELMEKNNIQFSKDIATKSFTLQGGQKKVNVLLYYKTTTDREEIKKALTYEDSTFKIAFAEGDYMPSITDTPSKQVRCYLYFDADSIVVGFPYFTDEVVKLFNEQENLIAELTKEDPTLEQCGAVVYEGNTNILNEVYSIISDTEIIELYKRVVKW